VADVVKLDANNRRLVAQGLKRIRSGRMHAGIAALFVAAGRDPVRASAADFGFALGPRLNAAGRLADMSLGIACLLCDEPTRAAELAQQLDAINRERREVEAGMRDQAEALLERLMPRGEPPVALVLFDEAFHEGVVGIVAGRLKERLNRPTFVFARGGDGLLKGSGRSIPGFHLRDALDLVAKREPELLKKFGGHAMAAGCTLSGNDANGANDADGVERFAAALQAVAAEWLDDAALLRRLATDGPLEPQAFEAATVRLLDAEVWGQAFEAPLFADTFDVVQQRLVGEKHLKLSLRHAGPDGAPAPRGAPLREAIWFGHVDALPERVRLAYRLSLDTWQGRERVQLVIEAAAPG
jgi:single-stranded-DNA-specific exonuclease